MAEEKIKNVKEKYTTGKGQLTGFIAITQPSQQYDNYQANILLSKEEGESLTAKLKELQKEQFILCGRKGKLAELPIKPYTTQNEETGEQVADKEGRYVLKTGNKGHNTKGEVMPKPVILNAKLQPITGKISIGEGTIARLQVSLNGYKAPMGIGISAKLLGCQIIDLVEYVGGGFSLDGFSEEDGFDGTGDGFTEETAEPVAGEEEEIEEF